MSSAEDYFQLVESIARAFHLKEEDVRTIISVVVRWVQEEE